MKKIWLSASVALFSLLPVVSFADDAQTASGSGSLVSGQALQDLAAAQGKVALLTEQLKIAKLQAEIAKAKKGDLGGSSGTPEFGMPTASPLSPELSPPSMSSHEKKQSAALPKVIDVMGVPGRYQANLSLPGGGTVAVTSGSSVGSSLRVLSVGPEGVRILRGQEKLFLPYESTSGGAVEEASMPDSSGGISAFRPSFLGRPASLPAPVGVPGETGSPSIPPSMTH